MKRLLNTLYVTTDGAYLARQRETVLVRVEHETRLQIPIHVLDGIIAFGHVSASPGLMELCGDKGVALSFFSTTGRFMARVEGPVSGNVLLRRTQFRAADNPDRTSALARSFLIGKIANARSVLRRSIRDRADEDFPDIQFASIRIARLLRRLQAIHPLEELRGIEGEAARLYFSVFDQLIIRDEGFTFEGRSKRPPLDKVNAMLSFVYSLLAHDAASALEGVGLDPAVGFLHRDRPGRPSLALDLLEEFRPTLGDRLVLTLINRGQVHPEGFKIGETGAVWMNDKTRKTVITAYQQRKKDEVTHYFLDEKVPVGHLMHIQARLLARHLRGDLDAYPPFFWK